MGNSSSRIRRPRFDELPLKPDDPPVSAWGLWGPDDELGSLNILTPEKVKAAISEVRTGETIPLNLSLDAFIQPMNPARKPCEHTIFAKGNANDDALNINTQGASHWDGPRHYPYQSSLKYYNGATQDDISGPTKNNRLGVHGMARKTITGRGVLLDWASWAEARGLKYDAFSTFSIPHSQILAVAEAQGVSFNEGDILFVRSGWLSAFHKLTPDQQASLANRPVRASMGLEASGESIRWHWDNGFAAVAGDTVAYEVWPSPREWRGISMHEVFLSGWGMPIGESFDLEVLAEKCKKRNCWSFMFVSVPLDIPGGVASPPNAVAII
ncbi:putative cyclase-domain-containing protein [Xylariaceae sp. FL1019]|nr:putative cyclase-domain-containing protein [Xylariaceae sp. FL1019]